MQWTDKIRRVNILLVMAAITIAVGSLLVSHYLTRDLREQEQRKMEVWAEAMRTLSNADENTDLNLVLKVLNDNNYIPVVVLDANGRATEFRNIELTADNYQDSLRQAEKIGRQLLMRHQNIRIKLSGASSRHDEVRANDFIDVCYDESLILKRLSIYPFAQMGVVLIFVAVTLFALLSSKRAEQNKVWVGLSKETAHQLGTPISSLMAWTDVLRETYPEDPLIPEMSKDVKRLELIADRFSKIGAKPEPVPTSLQEVVERVVDYMNRRTSHRVTISTVFPQHRVMVKLNSSLFEWVIENLCKNAVDAMGGENGIITLRVFERGDKAVIEVSDTGRGIKKKDVRNVFKPGFTTKRRGWGLGLSLAKRIVEEYHDGRIWVKNSEVGRGTTFRVELPLMDNKGRDGAMARKN